MDVFLARILSWFKRKPLVWDIFMSIYLIALERGLEKKNRITLQGLRWIERLACRLPDLLILDTDQYVNWFTHSYHLPASKFKLVPAGANDRIFQPAPQGPHSNSSFIVLYYGGFIPNHGVSTIINAAISFQSKPDVLFELVGDGPDRQEAEELVRNKGLKNIIFLDWLDQPELVRHIAQADICLGAFGITPQSMMTVQNKIYESLAMAKPVITGDSPAIRQTLVHGTHAWLVERASSMALATAIVTLRANAPLRQQLALNGYRLFQDNFTIAKLGERFREHLLHIQ
jgi:glycosyltransferase involved in cell wall biosynthesis